MKHMQCMFSMFREILCATAIALLATRTLAQVPATEVPAPAAAPDSIASKETLPPQKTISTVGLTADDAYELEPIVVTAARLPQKISDIPANVTVLHSKDLHLCAPSRLDDVLRQVPGFSLLRQSSSVVTSASLQGVSMRGIGPTNTGRTLVLMDGVPLNDPFSGHITWSRIPLGAINRIEVVRGGGSPIWGSLALGGVINVMTQRPEGASLRFRGQGGERETQNFELYATESVGKTTFSAGGSYFDTDGYHIWRPDQLGPIDVPAKLKSGALLGRVDVRPSDKKSFYVSGNYADEDRGKGTPMGAQGFITRGYGVGGEMKTGESNDWVGNVFVMSRSSDNFSTSVSADRTSERPSSNEHRAPCSSIGANLQWSRKVADAHQLSVGADQQWLEGESFTFGNWSTSRQDFTTEKHVQGNIQLLGGYVQDIYKITEQWQVIGSARLDVVRTFDASDVLSDINTKEEIARVDYDDDTKTTVNPSLGVVYHVNEDVSLRSSAYRAFRAPTISELYEGFVGRGGEITLGNDDLEPEQMVGGEAGVDFRPWSALTAKATGFWNEVDNTINQRTIGFADADSETVIPP
jgi:outer membrane cobalamin receptor